MSEQIFIATAPTGVEPLLAAELTELGAATPRPCSRRRRIPGSAGTGLSRLSVVAHRQPGAAAAGRISRRRRRSALCQHPRPALGRTSGAGRDLEHRIQRRRSRHRPQLTTARSGSRTPSWTGSGRAAASDRAWIARQPDLRIHARWRDGQATVSLDLSGDSLHRRGYREATVTAPLEGNAGRRPAAEIRLAGHRRCWRTLDRPALRFRHPGD